MTGQSASVLPSGSTPGPQRSRTWVRCWKWCGWYRLQPGAVVDDGTAHAVHHASQREAGLAGGLALVSSPARRLAQELLAHVAPAVVGRAKLVGDEVPRLAPGPSLQRDDAQARRRRERGRSNRPRHPSRRARRRPVLTEARHLSAGRSPRSLPAARWSHRASNPRPGATGSHLLWLRAPLRGTLRRCSPARHRGVRGTSTRACRGYRRVRGRRIGPPAGGRAAS